MARLTAFSKWGRIKKFSSDLGILARWPVYVCAHVGESLAGVHVRPASPWLPCSTSHFDFYPHLVLATPTCLPGHLSYLRSCQRVEKTWEDFKNLAEPAFSRIIPHDTFSTPNITCLVLWFFFFKWVQQETWEELESIENIKNTHCFAIPELWVLLLIFKLWGERWRLISLSTV